MAGMAARRASMAPVPADGTQRAGSVFYAGPRVSIAPGTLDRRSSVAPGALNRRSSVAGGRQRAGSIFPGAPMSHRYRGSISALIANGGGLADPEALDVGSLGETQHVELVVDLIRTAHYRPPSAPASPDSPRAEEPPPPPPQHALRYVEAHGRRFFFEEDASRALDCELRKHERRRSIVSATIRTGITLVKASGPPVRLATDLAVFLLACRSTRPWAKDFFTWAAAFADGSGGATGRREAPAARPAESADGIIEWLNRREAESRLASGGDEGAADEGDERERRQRRKRRARRGIMGGWAFDVSKDGAEGAREGGAGEAAPPGPDPSDDVWPTDEGGLVSLRRTADNALHFLRRLAEEGVDRWRELPARSNVRRWRRQSKEAAAWGAHAHAPGPPPPVFRSSTVVNAPAWLTANFLFDAGRRRAWDRYVESNEPVEAPLGRFCRVEHVREAALLPEHAPYDFCLVTAAKRAQARDGSALYLVASRSVRSRRCPASPSHVRAHAHIVGFAIRPLPPAQPPRAAARSASPPPERPLKASASLPSLRPAPAAAAAAAALRPSPSAPSLPSPAAPAHVTQLQRCEISFFFQIGFQGVIPAVLDTTLHGARLMCLEEVRNALMTAIKSHTAPRAGPFSARAPKDEQATPGGGSEPAAKLRKVMHLARFVGRMRRLSSLDGLPAPAPAPAPRTARFAADSGPEGAPAPAGA